MNAPIADLSQLSADLNKASDKATASLKKAEEHFRTLKLGFEVYLEEQLIPPQTESGPYARTVVFHLGWAKIEKGWRLVIGENHAVADTGEPMGFAVRPVLDASREVRIAALNQLNKLMAAIKVEGEHLLNVVENASKIKF